MSETSGDYGYDLAHEAVHQPSAPEQQPVFVDTQTSDQDEDLSYDLAHDVPR